MSVNPTPPEGSNPTETVFHSLLRTFGLLRQVMEPYFARFGISASQWAILRVLQRAASEGEPGLRLTDLSERVLIQPPSVTAVVDRLERQGLVKRSESKTDLRVRRVSLTSEGQELVARVLAGHAQQIQSLFGGLESAEIDRLGGLLRQMEEHLAALAHPHSEGTQPGRNPVEV